MSEQKEWNSKVSSQWEELFVCYLKYWYMLKQIVENYTYKIKKKKLKFKNERYHENSFKMHIWRWMINENFIWIRNSEINENWKKQE